MSERAYVEACVALAAEQLMVTPAQVFGRTREARPSLARAVVMTHLRRRAWTLEEIGTAFARDHSTVHSAANKIEQLAPRDPYLRTLLVLLDCQAAPDDKSDLHALCERLERNFAEGRSLLAQLRATAVFA